MCSQREEIMLSLPKKKKVGSWICLCLCLLLTVGPQQCLVQMANCFTKYSLKKVPVLLSHKKCFGSKFAFTKTLWSRGAEYVVAFLKKTVLLCFLLYSHFLRQTLLIFHLSARLSESKPFFFSFFFMWTFKMPSG